MSEVKTILVVEDSGPNRNILLQLLKKFGFEVIETRNGIEAWNKIEESERSGVAINAIISDVMMPGMSGIELLQKMRTENKLKGAPFVFITAVAEKEHILRARELKANGYILKPISKDKLLKKCQELFPDHIFPSLSSAS